jgi:hypothetical protein
MRATGGPFRRVSRRAAGDRSRAGTSRCYRWRGVPEVPRRGGRAGRDSRARASRRSRRAEDTSRQRRDADLKPSVPRLPTAAPIQLGAVLAGGPALFDAGLKASGRPATASPRATHAGSVSRSATGISDDQPATRNRAERSHPRSWLRRIRASTRCGRARLRCSISREAQARSLSLGSPPPRSCAYAELGLRRAARRS